MKAFLIDLSICNGCYNCQIVCKDEHVDNDWLPYARSQPDTGQFWMKQKEFVRGTVPKVKISYLPTPCMHCAKAPCIPACQVDAIYRREDGLVIIDPQKCDGCGDCVRACPYEAIYFNQELKLAQKCTGCAHLLDQGWKEPRCADACPTGAIRFGEVDEFSDELPKAEVLRPELECSPRVYYLNLPKRFIAGTVYDPDEEEVLIGAELTLTSQETGKSTAVKTDSFGDFWFNDLEEGSFTLLIVKDGYTQKSIETSTTIQDINLGDIPISRQ